MTKRSNGKKPYTGAGGKFSPGNPGRPAGARNKTSRAIEQLLDGEAEGLTRKAIELALAGDTTALRLCLERIAPGRKDNPVEFELPAMEGAEDASQAAGAVLAAVSRGELTPLEGASVMGLVENYRRTLELTEIELRMSQLEEVYRVAP